QRHPSAFLLAAQALLLIFFAVFDEVHLGRAMISALGVVVLILVVWVVTRSPAVNWIAWVLAVPAFLLTILSAIMPGSTLIALSALVEGVLYFYAAGSIIAYMLEDTQVTVDELFAAGATFTLLAWGYAYLYMVVQIWLPGSFVSQLDPDQPRTFLEFLSLSFTNLSATGLSDILPAAKLARVLVMMEQFTGVGYVAVVVSRLIGLTLQRSGKKS
ncbi:MAG TPA: ion channel, partial [Bellilinea sp.]